MGSVFTSNVTVMYVVSSRHIKDAVSEWKT